MKTIFVLSKDHIKLAKEEILSLVDTRDFELINDLLVVDTNEIDFKNKLGYSHSMYKFLFECSINNIEKSINEFSWNKIYEKNFCIRIHNSNKYSENQFADLIYEHLDKPIINLTNPKTKIEFFFRKNRVIVGLFNSDIDKSHNKRKAHLRPELHPTSMHPKLAKACINLTGLTKGKLLDPFCGSGGILIEAGLLGFKVEGYDIDEKQISRAKKNLEHYNIKNFELKTFDAIKIKEKVDAIVTDFPYGKGSKGNNLEELYETFLINAQKITKNIVVIFPNFIDYEMIIKKAGWIVEKKFEIYVHKSLTRAIIRLSPRHQQVS